MDIQAYYQKVIEGLRRDHRSLLRFTESELEFLNKELLNNPSEEVLCLIDHSAMPWIGFEKNLIEVLGRDLPEELKVFTLNCARKHIITARGQKGHRLPFEFLEALKALLHSSSPQVVEWTLRTIEECGPQGVYFLRELDKIKPPPWKWFNQHQRAVREIIAMLERRWSAFERVEKR